MEVRKTLKETCIEKVSVFVFISMSVLYHERAAPGGKGHGGWIEKRIVERTTRNNLGSLRITAAAAVTAAPVVATVVIVN